MVQICNGFYSQRALKLESRQAANHFIVTTYSNLTSFSMPRYVHYVPFRVPLYTIALIFSVMLNEVIDS